MTLLHPEFLWLLIPLALFAWLRYREGHAARLPVHPKLILDNRRTLLVRLAPFLALAWMIGALARPVTVQDSSEEAPGLSTLYLAVDASASMRGTDKKPDRFTFAKRSIERLVEKDKRHKFGLLAFTTNALILSPPTEDAQLVKAALNTFNPDFILTHGTSLEALLAYVARLGGESKELVIFSDGGDDEDLGELLGIARKHGIRIYAVACATKEGSKIPADEGWLRDENGRLVISSLNPQLETLAMETDGAFIDEETPEAVAEALMESVETVETAKESQQVRYREFFWVPLGLGVLFFLLGTLSMGAFKRLLAPILVLFGLQQAQAGWLDLWRLHQGYEAYRKGDYNASKEIFAAIRPPLLESTYALASAYYKLGAYKKAGRLYLKCKSTDPLIKRRIWYNLGNCAMKLGRYKSARDYYVKALQLGYDEEALENLKLALFLHERRQKRIEARANKKVEAQSSSGSSDQTKGSEKKASRSQSKMGQGSGSQSAAKSSRVGPKKGTSEATERYELGSKAYELINKGYVHEKRPW